MTTPHKEDGPLPLSSIRLSEAYNIFYRAVTPNWRELETGPCAILGDEQAERLATLATIAHDQSHKDAEERFRIALAGGNPVALVFNPKTSQARELARQPWTEKQNFGVHGFHEDFVSPDDLIQPGPDTLIEDALRPVFFERADFEKFMAEISAASKLATHAKAGRPTIIPDVIAPELDRWIASMHAGLVAKLKEHGQDGQKSGLAVARALKAWAESLDHYDVPDARSIQNALRAKIIEADRLL
jgi:hypothetical protein